MSMAGMGGMGQMQGNPMGQQYGMQNMGMGQQMNANPMMGNPMNMGGQNYNQGNMGQQNNFNPFGM